MSQSARVETALVETALCSLVESGLTTMVSEPSLPSCSMRRAQSFADGCLDLGPEPKRHSSGFQGSPTHI